jgi:predicted transcriptional regulator
MQRITTNVDPDVYERLEDLARRRNVPTARVIRDALERYVTDEEASQQAEPLPDWVGMLEGPGGPWAEHDEAVLDAAWTTSLEPRTIVG